MVELKLGNTVLGYVTKDTADAVMQYVQDGRVMIDYPVFDVEGVQELFDPKAGTKAYLQRIRINLGLIVDRVRTSLAA